MSVERQFNNQPLLSVDKTISTFKKLIKMLDNRNYCNIFSFNSHPVDVFLNHLCILFIQNIIRAFVTYRRRLCKIGYPQL